MADDRYIIVDQHATYFLTMTVTDWVDAFTRPEYKDIVVNSLNYGVHERGITCNAWVLMSNHLHLVASSNPPFRMSDFLRDFKKFTSKAITDAIQQISESRREWMLHRFEYAAKTNGRAENYKFWQDGNHPVCLAGDIDRYHQRVNYVHQNPVRQRIVENAADYLFSSARDYEGTKGLVNVTVDW